MHISTRKETPSFSTHTQNMEREREEVVMKGGRRNQGKEGRKNTRKLPTSSHYKRGTPCPTNSNKQEQLGTNRTRPIGPWGV